MIDTEQDQQSLKERLLSFIQARDHVTFVEMTRHFAEIDAPPGRGVALSKGENVILWAGLTKAASVALVELFEEGAIFPQAATGFVYLIDGGGLTLPVLKRAPGKRGLKVPHWLPVVLRPAKAVKRTQA